MPTTIPEALRPALNSAYPHRPRLLFLLRRRPEASLEAFEQALGNWRRRWPHGVDFGSVVARAGAQIVKQQAAMSARFSAGGAEVSAFDGYVSLDLESYAPTAADFDKLFGLAKGCLDSLRDVVDLAGTIALAGVVTLVIPGGAPLSMILLLDRPKTLTLEQYNSWWIHHGDDHRRLNPAQVGYHQLHIAPEFNAAAAKAAGVSTTDRCIIDVMYLGSLGDAFSKPGDRSAEESRALAADIGAHVSMASVGASFFKEL